MRSPSVRRWHRDFVRSWQVYAGVAVTLCRGIPELCRELARARKDRAYVNSEASYALMRLLYVMSGGYLFRLLERYISPSALPKTRFRAGFTKLHLDDCAALTKLFDMQCYSQMQPARRGKIGDFVKDPMGRIEIDQADLFASRELAELATSSLWKEAARAILGTKPIAVLLVAWWSKPSDGSARMLSESAQAWHRDIDRLRELKFFFYATDVALENGPLEYVQCSHLPSFRALSTNHGRCTDTWVRKRYPGGFVSMTGKAGDVFIVDTQGLHRGRPVERGMRCVLQLEFSSSVFGAEFQYRPRLPLRETWPSYPAWRKALEDDPDAWAPLFGRQNQGS